MSGERKHRILSASAFLLIAVFLLWIRYAYDSSWRGEDFQSWLVATSMPVLAVCLWPTRSLIDRGVQRLAFWAGVTVELIWYLSGNQQLARSPESVAFLLIILGGLILIWRSAASEGAKQQDEMPSGERPVTPAKIALAGVIVAIAIASVYYRMLVLHRLEQTSALFIGIPALLAVLVIFVARPKSTTGLLCKATAVALLTSGILLGEGFICILMAAPLFFLVAVVVGNAADWARERKNRSQTTMSCLLLLAFVRMSFEGTRAALSFPRDEVVQREIQVEGTPEQVAGHLAATPHFPASLPAFLRLGFPRPVATAGSGLHLGDRRIIHFAGGEGKPGDLVMEVVSAGANSVEFREISDTSHVAHWLRWESSRFEWSALPDGRTRVTCTVRYRRLLDPVWYFKPWERYGVGLSADYLLRSMTESSTQAN